jgi:hypothetical protein
MPTSEELKDNIWRFLEELLLVYCHQNGLEPLMAEKRYLLCVGNDGEPGERAF